MRARSLMVIAIRILALLCLAGAAGAQAFARCDVNGDGVVNQVDVRLISASLNRPAFGKLDARDADGDGRITLNDVRACLQVCRGPCGRAERRAHRARRPRPARAAGRDRCASTARGRPTPTARKPLTYAWQFTLRRPPAASVTALVGRVRRPSDVRRRRARASTPSSSWSATASPNSLAGNVNGVDAER